MSVIIDPAEGYARLGSVSVPIQLSSRDGSLQLDGDSGPILRPLTFTERSRLIAYAQVSPNSRQASGKLIVDAALQQMAPADPLILTIIAMVLAGGAESDLPSYSETALLLSQRVGWSPAQLGEAQAVEVDLLVKQLVPETEDGWTRLVFKDQSDSDLQTIFNRLADNLLRRVQPKRLSQHNQPTTAYRPSLKKENGWTHLSLSDKSDPNRQANTHNPALNPLNSAKAAEEAGQIQSSIGNHSATVSNEMAVSSKANGWPKIQISSGSQNRETKAKSVQFQKGVPSASLSTIAPSGTVDAAIQTAGSSSGSQTTVEVPERPQQSNDAEKLTILWQDAHMPKWGSPISGKAGSQPDSRIPLGNDALPGPQLRPSDDPAVPFPSIHSTHSFNNPHSGRATTMPPFPQQAHFPLRSDSNQAHTTVDYGDLSPSSSAAMTQLLQLVEPDIDEIVAEIARRLQLEADLRGIQR